MRRDGALAATLNLPTVFGLDDEERQHYVFWLQLLSGAILLLWIVAQLRTAKDLLRDICRRKKTVPCVHWEQLTERAYDVEEAQLAHVRHSEAVRGQWREWNHLGAAIRRAGSDLTAAQRRAAWARWNLFSRRLQAHPWHQQRTR